MYLRTAYAIGFMAVTASAALSVEAIYPQPIESTKNRVESLHTTIVCAMLGNVDKAISLHNADQKDMIASLGCVYIPEKSHGVSVDWLRAGYRQMMFVLPDSKVLMWGRGTHFTYVDDPA